MVIKQHLLFTLMILLTFFAQAQQIRIIDKATKKPIPSALIYNSDASTSVQTDEKGRADFSKFQNSDIITIQHTSYQEVIISYEDIARRSFKILMEERIIPIEEVTISANKWEQDKSEIPNDILQINGKTIEFDNPPTSADLLISSGEVFVQKSQLGGGSPMLRGFAANSVLLVVDGVRMNNAIYRSGNLQNVINIDPNALESAEVVFGPGSVIYGSDALGGVLDFHTINPKFSSSDATLFNATAFSRYATAANEKTNHLHFELGKENFALFSSVTYSDFSDLRTGSNRTSDFPDYGKRLNYIQRINGIDSLVSNNNPNIQKFSNYNLFNTVNKLKFRLSSLFELDYGFYFSTTSDIPRYDRLIQTNEDGSLRNAEWYYGPQKWMMHRVSATSYQSNPIYDQAKFVFSYQDYEESRNDRRVDSENKRTQIESVNIFNVNLDFDKSVGSGNLFYGLEFLFNDVASEAYNTNITTGEESVTASRYPDLGSEYLSYAAYANYKKPLRENLILNAGARFSQVNVSGETSDSEASLLSSSTIDLSNAALNGTAGIVYKITDEDAFSWLVSSGFRSPNIDDVGKVFELDDNQVTVPNNELKPETSYNMEISYKKEIQGKFTADVVAYYSRLNNAIVRAPFEVEGSSTISIGTEVFQVFAQQNTNKAHIYGLGGKIQYQLNPNWAITSSLHYTDGRDISNDDPLRHTPPVFGKTSLKYQQNKVKLDFYSEYNGSRSFENLAPSEQDKTWVYTADGSLAWYTLNLRGSYQINKFLRVNGGIENILDKHYRPYSSGISAPGRNFSISLRATF